MIRHRRPGQTLLVAALAMSVMIGTLSLVVDAGVYWVIQRQLQNAADAAALAAVWYAPASVCSETGWTEAGCQPTHPDPQAPECGVAPNAAYTPPYPCTAAVEMMKANWGVAMSLCAGPNLPAGAVPVDISVFPGPILVVPRVGTYVVTLSCDAPHWFARIFPAVNLTTHISVSASAALGWLGSDGQLVGGLRPTSTTPLVARLII